jgi:hypothetical protein
MAALRSSTSCRTTPATRASTTSSPIARPCLNPSPSTSPPTPRHGRTRPSGGEPHRAGRGVSSAPRRRTTSVIVMKVDAYEGWTTRATPGGRSARRRCRTVLPCAKSMPSIEARTRQAAAGRVMSDLPRLRGKNFGHHRPCGHGLLPRASGHEDRTRDAFLLLPGRVLGQYRAVALVKLGGKADAVTCVSDDAIGRFA